MNALIHLNELIVFVVICVLFPYSLLSILSLNHVDAGQGSLPVFLLYDVTNAPTYQYWSGGFLYKHDKAPCHS